MRLQLPFRGRRVALDELATAYATAKLPRGRTPWREAGWCAVDLELTGLDPHEHEIISFGAIPIEQGRVRLKDAVAGLVRPTHESSDAAVRIHGLRNVDLDSAPSLADSMESLLPALTGRILVAHTAVIERSFLSRALAELGLRLRGPVVDVEVLARLWLFERDGLVKAHIPLSQIAQTLGLPAERPHVALGDALTTAQVFIALAAHLDAHRPETVRTLERATRRADALRALHRGVL
jgi:DNA polymerase III subunit epsilon